LPRIVPQPLRAPSRYPLAPIDLPFGSGAEFVDPSPKLLALL
jgi:hypothetical protein